MKIRIKRDDLEIREHLYYLKRPAILQNSFSVVTLLTSLFKKLQEQQGISDRDDLNRGANVIKRQNINNYLRSSPEVVAAIEAMRALGDEMDADALTPYIVFM